MLCIERIAHNSNMGGAARMARNAQLISNLWKSSIEYDLWLYFDSFGPLSSVCPRDHLSGSASLT